MSGFCARLRDARRLAKLTQTALGAGCRPPLSKMTISALESSKQAPSALQAQQLADALKVSRCWLAWGDKCNDAA